MFKRALARIVCLFVYLFAALAGCARTASPAVTAPARGDSAPAAREPFTLDVTPSLTGSRDAVLRAGDQVRTGDGINVAVKASADAHLYLGYCDRDRKLTLFPQEGSIEAKAGEITYAPARGANITLDAQTGPEVLYVIGSRRRLDLADPELASAISKVRPGARDVECGAALNQVLESKGPAPAPTRSVAAASAPRVARASAPGKVASQRAARVPPADRDDDRLPPPAKLERGAYITWGAAGAVSASGDRDAIVVLRYTFTHVAR